MPLPPSPNQNRLLAALPTADFERLAAHLEPVPLRLGDTLYEPGGQLQHVYFPTTAIVSLLYVLESGASAEIAGVGNEGVLGIACSWAGNTTPSSAWCRPRATATGCRGNCSRKNSIAPG